LTLCKVLAYASTGSLAFSHFSGRESTALRIHRSARLCDGDRSRDVLHSREQLSGLWVEEQTWRHREVRRADRWTASVRERADQKASACLMQASPSSE